MDIDSIALEAARNVMNELLANSYPKGGNVQLQAIIQCKIADVLRQQLAEQTSGEPIYQIFELNGCWSDVTLDFYTGCNRDKRIVYLGSPSVEVLLEALREIVDGRYKQKNAMCDTEMADIARDALNAYSSKPQKHLDN
jgi:hypothetical protein